MFISFLVYWILSSNYVQLGVSNELTVCELMREKRTTKRFFFVFFFCEIVEDLFFERLNYKDEWMNLDHILCSNFFWHFLEIVIPFSTGEKNIWKVNSNNEWLITSKLAFHSHCTWKKIIKSVSCRSQKIIELCWIERFTIFLALKRHWDAMNDSFCKRTSHLMAHFNLKIKLVFLVQYLETLSWCSKQLSV